MDENQNNLNAPLFDTSLLGATQALFEHDQITMNSNKKPVNGGVTDDFSEVRLRVAQIDNYLIERNGEKIDPLKVDNIINMKLGKVVIRWVEYNGGIIRPEKFGYPSEGYTEDWKYFPEKDSKYPEKRTLDCYNHDKASDRETLDLTHAFIWNNGSNWCGMNYLPPVGSIVVVGFKRGGLPIILGYLQTDYEDCKPFLKPGETIIKGYGKNYIHWRLSDKLDINVKCKKGEKDMDDPYKKDTYPNTIEMWMRFDCYTRNIIIDVNQTDSNKRKTTIEIKPENCKITSKNADNDQSSFVNISPDDINANVQGIGSLFINKSETNIKHNDSYLQINDSGININTNGKLNIQSNTIDIKSNGYMKVNSSVIELNASSNVNINGSGITLGSSGSITLNAPGGVNASSSIYNLN